MTNYRCNWLADCDSLDWLTFSLIDCLSVCLSISQSVRLVCCLSAWLVFWTYRLTDRLTNIYFTVWLTDQPNILTDRPINWLTDCLTFWLSDCNDEEYCFFLYSIDIILVHYRLSLTFLTDCPYKSPVPIYTPGWKCHSQEYDTVTPALACLPALELVILWITCLKPTCVLCLFHKKIKVTSVVIFFCFDQEIPREPWSLIKMPLQCCLVLCILLKRYFLYFYKTLYMCTFWLSVILYLTIRLRAWVFYKWIVNFAAPHWLSLMENEVE